MSEEGILKKLGEHDKRFDDHDKRFDQLDKQVDLIAKKVLEHDERLDRIEQNMATKKDLREISGTLDKLVKLAVKKDQEVTMLGHNQKLMQDDINRIKPLVGLAV